MILIDSRAGSGRGKADMLPIMRAIGLPCQKTDLPYGDAAFDGKGPNDSTVSVGIERKTLHDMLTCIEDARYSAHQMVGMRSLYSVSFLALEGMWEPGSPAMPGVLIQGFQHGGSWGPIRTGSSRKVQYAKLYRYLISVALSGVIITLSNDLYHTAYNIGEIYQYFQKPWDNHTSMLQTQKLALPRLDGKSSLTYEWATRIDEVGVKFGLEAEKIFPTPIALAKSGESDWLQIPGLGVRRARRIVRQINGWK